MNEKVVKRTVLILIFRNSKKALLTVIQTIYEESLGQSLLKLYFQKMLSKSSDWLFENNLTSS